MSCFSLLLQHAPLSFDFSLANFNDLVAKCSSNLFKSLVSRLPVDGVIICSETVTVSGGFRKCPLLGRVRVGVGSNSREIEVCNNQEEESAGDENVVVVL